MYRITSLGFPSRISTDSPVTSDCNAISQMAKFRSLKSSVGIHGVALAHFEIVTPCGVVSGDDVPYQLLILHSVSPVCDCFRKPSCRSSSRGSASQHGGGRPGHRAGWAGTLVWNNVWFTHSLPRTVGTPRMAAIRKTTYIWNRYDYDNIIV